METSFEKATALGYDVIVIFGSPANYVAPVSYTHLRAALAVLWLLFLPNTFYMLTDLIHTPQNMEWVNAADWTCLFYTSRCV